MSNKVKEFSQLPKLFQTNVRDIKKSTVDSPTVRILKPGDPMGSLTKLAAFNCAPDDSPQESVWKLMADLRPRTLREIVAELSQTAHDAADIRTTVRYLNSVRWFDVIGRGVGAIYMLPKNKPYPGKDVICAMAAPTTNPQPGELSPTDKLKVLIWKVFSDRKQHTAESIVQSLTPLGVRKSSVMALITRLSIDEGWFDRKILSGGGRRWCYLYTLRSGITMPVLAAHHQQWGERPTEVVKVMCPMPPEPQTPVAAAVVSTEQPAQSPAPVIELVVRFKGVEFSLAEARGVAIELRRLGYGPRDNYSKHPDMPLIEKTIRVKGVEFADEELDEIVTTMQYAALI